MSLVTKIWPALWGCMLQVYVSFFFAALPSSGSQKNVPLSYPPTFLTVLVASSELAHPSPPLLPKESSSREAVGGLACSLATLAPLRTILWATGCR